MKSGPCRPIDSVSSTSLMRSESLTSQFFPTVVKQLQKRKEKKQNKKLNKNKNGKKRKEI